MSFINRVVSGYFAARSSHVEKMLFHPMDCQDFQFNKLIESAKKTQYGKKYDFSTIKNYQQFANRLPINNYNSLYPYIQRMIKGEKNVLWAGKINYFSKSSGTSGNKSKFIPVSQEALWANNFKSGKDTFSLYIANRPDSKLFNGKFFSLTGSLRQSELNSKAICGDVSAILLKSVPQWTNLFKTPPYKIALLDNWEIKLEKFAQHLRHENVAAMAGVPSWILMILRRILELENKQNICEIWNNLELFLHGGVNFSPYKEQYQNITNSNVYFWQVYNASEGYFATQDRPFANDMLLLVNNGVFYEFIPLQDLQNENPTAIPLDQVKIGQNYAIVISTNAGLWRYIIGDVVQFTSLAPYRIIITGRTTHFINAFGEELIVDNVEKALEKACKKTQSIVNEYTIAPIYLSQSEQASHEWLIEFEKKPASMADFVQILDQELKNQNSDYEAKRSKNLLLQQPQIQIIPNGTFLKWLSLNNRLGGQYKVPRLSNNRTIVEEILSLLKK